MSSSVSHAPWFWPARVARLACLGVVTLAIGCADPSAPSPGTSQTSSHDEKSNSTKPPKAAPKAASLSSTPRAVPEETAVATERSGQREYWDLCLIRSATAGYVHSKFTELNEESGPVIRGELEQLLEMERFGQSVQQQIWLVCWQTKAGELLRFESRVTAGREATIAKGNVTGEKLTIVTTTPGKTETATVAWKPKTGGFFAVEESLRGEPLRAGEKRTIASLAPILHQVVRSDLQAIGFEAVRIGDESEQLLKIQRTDRIGTFALESTLWMNSQGEIRQQFMPLPAPGMTYVRADRAAALSGERRAALDLGQSTVVQLRDAPADLAQRKQARFRAELTTGTIAELFEAGISQQVRVTGERSAEIHVSAVRPDSPLPPELADGNLTRPPMAADRQPNALIQSDDKLVQQLAKSILPEERDSWKLAVGLEQLVHRRIQSKNFTQAFATAAEVAQSGEGDCTEHAVLLAALCRAREIPARVAIGLLYVPNLQGLGYHMWNEVWIHDRWVPLDATLGLGGIQATHLKLLTSNLDGYDAYAALLPVFRVLGQLQLTWLEEPAK